MKRVLVTGGCGFLGGSFVRLTMDKNIFTLLNLDALTYAAQEESLANISAHHSYAFINGSITDKTLVLKTLYTFKPDFLINFAAETHVDRSIFNPSVFFETNTQGTLNLLECCSAWLKKSEHPAFRFIQVSTDEVYGDLGLSRPPAKEIDLWQPSSPYAASKAAADHLVDAWYKTYGFPAIVTHASNNYGPWQFPEKLVPLVIQRALQGNTIPIYGSGEQVRDWLHVDDHVRALLCVIEKGALGEHYNIGADQERMNIELVSRICSLLDELSPSTKPKGGHAALVKHVEDRAGHDWRYALDSSKVRALGWQPEVSFGDGLRETVLFYLSRFGEQTR